MVLELRLFEEDAVAILVGTGKGLVKRVEVFGELVTSWKRLGAPLEWEEHVFTVIQLLMYKQK